MHRAGKTFRVPNARYDPGHVFDARVAKAMSLVENPTHPLYGRVDLVLKFVAALEPAVAHARASAAVAEGVDPWRQLLGQCHARWKIACFNDLERIALGPAAVDLSAVKQGMDHFGWLDETGERFRNAYGPDAPTLREVGPYARIRELSGILITMLFADESAEMEAEMHKRLVAIENPGEGEQWTWVGNRRNAIAGEQPFSLVSYGP